MSAEAVALERAAEEADQLRRIIGRHAEAVDAVLLGPARVVVGGRLVGTTHDLAGIARECRLRAEAIRTAGSIAGEAAPR